MISICLCPRPQRRVKEKFSYLPSSTPRPSCPSKTWDLFSKLHHHCIIYPQPHRKEWWCNWSQSEKPRTAFNIKLENVKKDERKTSKRKTFTWWQGRISFVGKEQTIPPPAELLFAKKGCPKNWTDNLPFVDPRRSREEPRKYYGKHEIVENISLRIELRAVYAVVKKGSGLQRENTTKADGMILSHLSRCEGEANPQSLDPKGAASHSAHSYLAIFPITHILSFPRLRIRRMYHTREWARFKHGLIGHLWYFAGFSELYNDRIFENLFTEPCRTL